MLAKVQVLSIRSILAVSILCVIASAGAFAWDKGAQGPTPPDRGSENYETWLTREVGHELIQVPWLSVFDNLQYGVKGSEVTLSGQVWQPVTKDDAQTAVKRIEGVTKVNNNIEVLPTSPVAHLAAGTAIGIGVGLVSSVLGVASTTSREKPCSSSPGSASSAVVRKPSDGTNSTVKGAAGRKAEG